MSGANRLLNNENADEGIEKLNEELLNANEEAIDDEDGTEDE